MTKKGYRCLACRRLVKQAGVVPRDKGLCPQCYVDSVSRLRKDKGGPETTPGPPLGRSR